MTKDERQKTKTDSKRTPLHQQVDTLPELVSVMVGELTYVIKETFDDSLCEGTDRIFVTGCGDSHHAALNSELAFERLSGLPCEPMTAMQFSRYGAGFIPHSKPGSNLVLAISVSGQVSRTAEALEMGRQAGATAVAITGNPNGALAEVADLIVETAVPPLPDELQGLIVPGTRSYIASQLTLYLIAIFLGEKRNHLTQKQANQLRGKLLKFSDWMAQTIIACDSIAAEAAQDWLDGDQFVFCGSGPNYGTALFSAAKLIEASGDAAIGQDMEEWAHLQYFGKQPNTPTFLLSAGNWDADRTAEIATAAKHIDRRVALAAPEKSALWQTAVADFKFPLIGDIHEYFSPLVTCLPGTLFAAYRAKLLDEPYFRDFGGGRSAEGGGGISRIRDSHRLKRIRP